MTQGRWTILHALVRPRLALAVALSAATGATAAAGWTGGMGLAACACFLLAAGASVLNQVQERRTDGLMERTAGRPLPRGLISPRRASLLAVSLIAAGFALLLAMRGRPESSPLALAAAALAIAWYNGFYTWLKRRTAFAAVPGALVGSLGPAIGWLAAGGPPASPQLLLLMLVFFLWQVPHFWLLVLKHAADYERAGFPTPARVMGERSLRRVTFVWILAAILAALMLPVAGLVRHGVPAAALVLCAVALGILCAPLLSAGEREDHWLSRSFSGVNLFAVAAMMLLLLDHGLRLG
ncbi:MAG: UbiA family prenyltransferase [Candidatus Eisenbacteria bacterium]